MTYKKHMLGTAIALALSSLTLASCSQGGNSNGDVSGMTADASAEKQIRDAIAKHVTRG